MCVCVCVCEYISVCCVIVKCLGIRVYSYSRVSIVSEFCVACSSQCECDCIGYAYVHCICNAYAYGARNTLHLSLQYIVVCMCSFVPPF